jgi:signal transduction histidine kinase
MKNTKRKIFIFTISSIVLSSVIVMVAFNLMMQTYIKNEAVKALGNEIELYRSIHEQTDDYMYTVDSVESIQVDAIYLDLNYEQEFDFYLSESNKELIAYFKENPGIDEEIRRVSIKNDDFYVAQIHVKDSYYVTPLEIEDASYEGDNVVLENNESYEYIVILFANVKPLNLLSKSMNKVFLGVLLAFILLSGGLGIRLGKQIENSQEKLKQFFQNVSHELKTPIMSIQGYAEGIQTNVIKDQMMATQIIIDESQKMSALVEELLYISKIDSGQITTKNDPIEIKELIYDCLRSIEMMARGNGIEIKIEFDETSPIIYGDEKQLAKAFTNIIVNALSYAKSQINITCNEYKKYLEIVIRDDGDGISEKDLPHIFERFYTGEKGNTGIGLALTKEIIEVHNGKITADNQVQGAEFKVVLNHR